MFMPKVFFRTESSSGKLNQAVLAQAAKNLAEVEAELALVLAGHLKVVRVGETEGQAPLQSVDFPLEGITSVAHAKGHPGGLEEAEGCGCGPLRHVLRMHGDLVAA